GGGGAGGAPDLHPVGLSAHHDDRWAVAAEVLPPAHYNLRPAHDRQSKIHDDDIRLAHHRKTERMLAVERADRVVAGIAKSELDDHSDRIIVLNDEHPEHRHGRTLRPVIYSAAFRGARAIARVSADSGLSFSIWMESPARCVEGGRPGPCATALASTGSQMPYRIHIQQVGQELRSRTFCWTSAAAATLRWDLSTSTTWCLGCFSSCSSASLT